MADNELLLLKTRVRKGVISFNEDNVKFRYSGWKVLDLKRNASILGGYLLFLTRKGTYDDYSEQSKGKVKSAQGYGFGLFYIGQLFEHVFLKSHHTWLSPL